MQFNREDILHTVLEYLDLLANGRGSAAANLHALEVILDKLALAVHFADPEKEEGVVYPEAPRDSYERFHDLAAERFPDFGFYNFPSSLTQDIGEAEMYMGSAITDVAETANSLWEVAWHWQNSTADYALWQFQAGYDSYWGEHLRHLQSYIRACKDRF